MKNLLFTFSVLLFSFSLIGQKLNDEFKLHINKTNLPVTIDGILDEEAWQSTDVATNFQMIQPVDKQTARQQSEARMTFDDEFIYIAVIFYNSEVKGPYNVESYRRDFSFNKNDNLLIAIDPFNNRTTGFSFGLNAYGAQWDGTMFNGGKVDLNWDTKWFSAVSFDEDKWIGEMAIPFKSIRYEEGVNTWRINFGRLDLKANEKSAWAPVPRQFPSVSLAYTGQLIWDTPPPSQNKNVSFIPYVSSAINSTNGITEKPIIRAGGDVKIGIGAALNLDLTVTPDFSNTEVDQEVSNLDRFELFFPEKRQFFLENADLFANFGYDRLRPFFSRRIGLGVPIIAGLRLSGNLNENLRVGLMNIQTNTSDDLLIPAENFGVLSIQQKIQNRSSIGLMLVNKQAINFDQDVYPDLKAYNRSVGLEYNFASPNNLWEAKSYYLHSLSPVNLKNQDIFASHVAYNSTNWKWSVQQEYVGANLNAEVGFIPRTKYFKLNSTLGYLFYLKDRKRLLSHGPGVNLSQFYNLEGTNTDYTRQLDYNFNFLNRSSLKISALNQFVMLQSPFDPTQRNGTTLPIGSAHKWNTVIASYASRPQSLFTYNLSADLGGYYQNGEKRSIYGELGYRFQPYASINGILTHTTLEMPAPWNTYQFWLIGTKLDFTFTKNLFFSNIFQYNEQKEVWGFNSRLQWRYKPASDIFIVFNSREQNLLTQSNSWSLSFKINYWLNR